MLLCDTVVSMSIVLPVGVVFQFIAKHSYISHDISVAMILDWFSISVIRYSKTCLKWSL